MLLGAAVAAVVADVAVADADAVLAAGNSLFRQAVSAATAASVASVDGKSMSIGLVFISLRLAAAAAAVAIADVAAFAVAAPAVVSVTVTSVSMVLFELVWLSFSTALSCADN